MLGFCPDNPSLTRLLFVATAVIVLSTFTESAQDTSGLTATCDVSQYLGSATNKCVAYSSRGGKAGRAYDMTIDSDNTAWMLMSSALVMLMTPGVAFCYAGLAGEDMASNTMMISDGIFAWAGFNNVGAIASGTYGGGIPHILFAFFQTQFAAITPALISGGIVGRMKFGSYLLFVLLWTSIVHDPLARWMWSLKLDENWEITALGWEGKMGSLDFAGGTIIHVSSGFGTLVAAIVVGAADGIAAIAAINTHLAPCAGFLTWLALEFAVHKKFYPCGAISGAVAGLVAITPGCAFVYPWAAVIFGVVGAATGFGAVHLTNVMRYDDTLDSFAIHGCGGFMGGAFYGHGIQFVHQLVSQCVTAAYSAVVTFLILMTLKYTVGLRVSEEKEVNGMDVSYHGDKV